MECPAWEAWAERTATTMPELENDEDSKDKAAPSGDKPKIEEVA